MMSTATECVPAEVARSQARPSTGAKGFLRRIFDAIVAAQQARADRYLMATMAQLPDHQLAELGFKPEQIREVRGYRGRSAAWL
jgi:hypothetical protein